MSAGVLVWYGGEGVFYWFHDFFNVSDINQATNHQIIYSQLPKYTAVSQTAFL